MNAVKLDITSRPNRKSDYNVLVTIKSLQVSDPPALDRLGQQVRLISRLLNLQSGSVATNAKHFSEAEHL